MAQIDSQGALANVREEPGAPGTGCAVVNGQSQGQADGEGEDGCFVEQVS